ncbi:MAG: GNAT family N-acetyltransferase [Candidatus Heimdallarchaeota archaeon]|nr:GNAT family N-acetyltransferase [Candidatus Heimdallarchaeota archaeon]
MIELTTEQLIIRNFTSKDWDDLFQIGMNYEKSEYAKYDHGPWPDSPEVYKGIVDSWSKNDDFLAVVLKGDKKMIGFISVPRKSNKIFDFGFVFHPDYHGSGYATKACQVVLKHIFDAFQAIQVNTGTAKENIPSCNLLRRLGFTSTGENNVSFRTDEVGNPIEFVALDFVLSREDYIKKHVS